MAIKKPLKNGMREVWVYHPQAGRKVYVGRRKHLRGPGGAEQLERDKKREFELAAKLVVPSERMTARQYAERWLQVKHGPNTKRRSDTTRKVNEGNLRPFLGEFGDRLLDSFKRREALDWAVGHPHNARTVAAMFADAVDDEYVDKNVWANRQQALSKGRRNITPITEGEVERLAEIAEEMWKGYGPTCAAWILFLAWTGCRPGEAFKACWEDLDLEEGLFTVTRIKPPYNTDTVVLPARAVGAVERLGHREGRLFSTVQGRRVVKGASRYYWDPVRKVFLAGLDRERREALLSNSGSLDLYELRHACGSMLADAGLSEFDISKQLGQSPEVCRDVYLHRFEDRTRERLREAFGRAAVADLGAARQRKMGGAK